MKRRLLAIFLTLCLILGLFPISASAADSGSLDVTTIYVSNQGGGDGTSEKDPTTLESALETINRAESDTENPLKFIISILKITLLRCSETDTRFVHLGLSGRQKIPFCIWGKRTGVTA